MRRLFRRGLIPWLSVIAGLGLPAEAHAQQYLIGADGGLSSGMEGGGQGALRRTRTRLRLGADLRIDESPEDIIEFAMLAELEPQSGLGGDVRYARMVGSNFVVDAGILGIVAPSSLYGVCAGLTYRLPISKTAQVTFGPEADFFFLGTDLPSSVVLWQMRFQAGFRVDL